jgi:hypothetical protein
VVRTVSVEFGVSRCRESGIIIFLVFVYCVTRQGEMETVSTYMNMCSGVEVWR